MEAVLDAELLCHCIFYTCFHIYYTDPSFSKIDVARQWTFIFKMANNASLLFLGFFFLKMKTASHKGFKYSSET